MRAAPIGSAPLSANLREFLCPALRHWGIGKHDWNFQAAGRISHLHANVHLGNPDFSGLYSSSSQNARLREVGIGKCMKAVSSCHRKGVVLDP